MNRPSTKEEYTGFLQAYEDTPQGDDDTEINYLQEGLSLVGSAFARKALISLDAESDAILIKSFLAP